VSLGIGAVFVPFGLVASAEFVLAASYAAHLSEIVADVVSPFALASGHDGSVPMSDEIPTPAVFVPDEFEPEVLANPPPATKKRGKIDPGNPAKPAALPAIYVTAQAVLRIANSGRRPSGKSVTAQGRRPAGVQVFGASSLGVGVRDGDVITRVSAVPVTSASQVIALVIAARGARQSAISAEVYRGQRSYTLTVEQPYPPGADDPPKGDAGVQTSDTVVQANAETPDRSAISVTKTLDD
jgi:hypothetical protein